MVAISRSVTIKLANEELWKEFNVHMTEMIVTKTGRKLFPKIEVSVEGLEPNENYVVILQMERVGETRFKFATGDWIPAGSADANDTPKAVSHHDACQLGKTWMRGPICFDRIKLTNSPMDGSQKIQLHSMHKYRPRLLIYRMKTQPAPFAAFSIPHSELVPVASFSDPVMNFIAVTAYQNQNIIKLKIKYNPFAKGFREGNERKRCCDSPCSSSSLLRAKKPRTEVIEERSLSHEKLNPHFPLPPHPTIFPSFAPYSLRRPAWPYPAVWNFGPVMPACSFDQMAPYTFNPPLASYPLNPPFRSYPM